MTNMRLLFEMDAKNYDMNGTVVSRPSVRGIIVRGNEVALVYSEKHDCYQFPGGGMEPGESQMETLIREVREETGLIVIPDSVREFGYVHRIEKGKFEDVFIQDNFYYVCAVTDEVVDQKLEAYEDEEGLRLMWVPVEQAIETNQRAMRETEESAKTLFGIARETRVLEMVRKAEFQR